MAGLTHIRELGYRTTSWHDLGVSNREASRRNATSAPSSVAGVRAEGCVANPQQVRLGEASLGDENANPGSIVRAGETNGVDLLSGSRRELRSRFVGAAFGSAILVFVLALALKGDSKNSAKNEDRTQEAAMPVEVGTK